MKILFSDFDGTLYDEGKALSEKNTEMINELRRQGHLMVICTGRNYKELMRDLTSLDIPFDYLVLNNGGHIVDKNHQTIYLKEIKKEVGIDILDYIMQYDKIFAYYFDGNRHLGHYQNMTVDNELFDQEIDDDFIKQYHQVNSFHIIWFYQKDTNIECSQKCLDYILEKHGDEVEATYNKYFVDVVPKGCSKATGVKALVDYIGNIDEIYAVGDAANDLPMILESDYGYTFHSSSDEIKEKTYKQVNYVYEVIEDMLKGA